MTDENLAKNAGSEWASFWANLKQGYDSFEKNTPAAARQRVRNRYHIQDAASRWRRAPQTL